MVLSHGFGTDQSAWSRVLPYLTRDHRVVLYDLVCAGSVNPEHFDFRRYNTLDSYVDDLLAITIIYFLIGAVVKGLMRLLTGYKRKGGADA